MKERSHNTRRMAVTSLLLVLIALAGVTAVTLAWFSIADNTRVYSMDMDVTTGASLRFDLDPHGEFIEYIETLSMDQIFGRIQRDLNYDPYTARLTPVTTADGRTFTLRNGTEQSASSGAFYQFTLHFMSTEDLVVHLSSANSRGRQDGTLVTSSIANLPESMRISFTCRGETVIYDPGTSSSYRTSENIRIFGLPRADQMLYNDENSLFSMKAETDTEVLVCIWIEGTDEACTNDLKGGDFSIRLRFVGTREDNSLID